MSVYDGAAWVQLTDSLADREIFQTTIDTLDDTIETTVSGAIESLITEAQSILEQAGSVSVIVGKEGRKGPKGSAGIQGASGTVDNSQLSLLRDEYNRLFGLYGEQLIRVVNPADENVRAILNDSSVITTYSSYYQGLASTTLPNVLSRISDLQSRFNDLVSAGLPSNAYQEILDTFFPIGIILEFQGLNSSEELVVAGMTFAPIAAGRCLVCDNATMNGDGLLDFKERVFAAGSSGGVSEVTLTAQQTGVPYHVHQFNVAASEPSGSLLSNGVRVVASTPEFSFTYVTNMSGDLNATTAHDNMPPYNVTRFYERVG
jgi:hypothetical protein